jgi:hypothetical protein
MKTSIRYTILFCLANLLMTGLMAQQVDICVYGGTSAGVIAAYTAKKMGRSVILIEPGRHLGGLSAGGLGYTDIGNKYVVTGLARDFYRQLGDHYGKLEQWIFEPHVAENIFRRYIQHAQVKVLYTHRIRSVEKKQGLITAIVLENTIDPKKQTLKISAAQFIDCSYEGDLMAAAGVSYTVGREGNDLYHESINGVQLKEGHQFPDGIDPYKEKGNPASGLLWGISGDKLEQNGSGDRKVQSYNYRICLTNNPSNKVDITRPKNYDASRYELLLRLMQAQPAKRKLDDYFIWSRMPNQKTDINNRNGFSTDMIGMNYRYPDGSYATRDSILQLHRDYTQGLLYFVGHDARVPLELRNAMSEWGYPADEYTDNGHWTPQLYIREARRMVGAYVMTEANCIGKEKVSDGIGMAAYTMDSHNCERIVVNGMVKNEGNVEQGGFGPYPISYRSLLPKQNECSNLLVPVCLSASHIAYGSIRMEPVFMVMAQSAAVAAVIAVRENRGLHSIAVQKITDILAADPLADKSSPEILVDNSDSSRLTIKGNWKLQAKESYGPDMLVAQTNADNSSSIQFNPTILSSGQYMVYSYYPHISNGADSTLVSVSTGKTIQQVVLKKSQITVEGQTSGVWVPLGEYTFVKGSKPFIEITTQYANGITVADAVLLIPKKQRQSQ